MLYIVSSYLIGTVMTAWFVGKLYGKNLLNENSGNLGARNAGKTLGKKAFILTALGDVLKGVVVVWIGRYLNLDEGLISAGIVAVVCGHLYPFWLKGKGGKAVATLLGALLLFSWQASLAFCFGFLVVLAIKRSATFSFIGGLFTYSAALLFLQVEGLWLVLVAIALVIWKHRTNILERMK